MRATATSWSSNSRPVWDVLGDKLGDLLNAAMTLRYAYEIDLGFYGESDG